MTDAAAAPQTNIPEYTVSELSGALKRTIEEAYGFVRVRGELGRTLIAKSGHLYTDLKDDRAVINGVMWKTQIQRLGFKPEEGLEVVVEGRLSTYPGRSQYQIIIERMAPAGVGALMALLEERKKKLAAEGLFAEEKKRALPFLPETVGVVTSPTGAVIRDILHRIADRFPVRVLVWPVLVQGEQAAGQVAAAIEGFNRLAPGGPVPRPDVLIIARGGGSIEDLWAFNEEIVVRAAAASGIPLISAVGHETDTTLIDHAADRRAPTPTGAAEIAVPVRADLAARLDTLKARSGAIVRRHLERCGAELRGAARGLRRPEDLLGPRVQRLDQARQSLRACLQALVDRASVRFSRIAGRLRPEALGRDVTVKHARLDELTQRARDAGLRRTRACAEQVRLTGRRLAQASPSRVIARQRERFAECSVRLSTTQGRVLIARGRELEQIASRLESVNPKAVLERGYALVRRADGALARRAEGLAAGDAVSLEFADGARGAVIADGVSSEKKTRRDKRRAKSDTDQGALF